MTALPRQEKRAAVLTTTKEADYLVVSRFDGSEAISESFEYRIEALSRNENIDFDELLGKHMTLTLNSINGVQRKFDGILTETQWLGVRDHFHAYRLVLRPWFWLLSHCSDCYIFHDSTVQDIVNAVFGRHSFASFEDRTGGSYPKLEYCVQYRESDMAFVSRLLEEFGISYFFEHKEGSHKLVLVDDNSKFETAPGGERPYRPLTGQDRRSDECFNHWIPERRFTSGRITVRDYNFKTPNAQMQADNSGVGSYDHADQEVYDYPGRYEKQADGKSAATYRMHAEEALDKRCMATGNCVTLAPGHCVALSKHPVPSYNTEYVVLRAQHSFVSQSYRSGGSGNEESYDGQYELIASDIPFRPLMTTRKPVIYGPQTALVVSPSGEEIDCDEYGRILVRFFWDRHNDHSIRCRVGQSWASAKWGGMIVPRVGMEVIVEFLDGDPDRPLVTGCVYNANNMPPNELPALKTRSVFKTSSHRGSGSNEIRFEDEAGEEEIWIHAQKYLNTAVEHDETLTVGNNRHTAIGASESETVGADKDLSVGSSYRETIGKDNHLVVAGGRTESVGRDNILTVGTNYRVDAGMAQHLTSGSTFYIQSGSSVVIDSGATMCLKAGGSFITLSPAGIQIEGTLVRINCGGAPLQGSPVTKKDPDKVKGPHAKRYDRSFKK
ncbi:type VI secretion system Vgr family protein [Sinorhizobium fredii]|uniref:type VI secretion system Vgr family protein n=1 Tax=Rhizobium fredii TaxID=380 RepID=UPI0004B9A62F|nr:type VI secretion system tip protein TssI/VgrG [Sinorhizobium fredii]